MTSEELSNSVVSVLSDYLTRKLTTGNIAYSAPLENLLGEVEAKMTGPYEEEKFARFVSSPSDSVDNGTLKLHLAGEITRDPDFRRRLEEALATRTSRKSNTRGKRLRWIFAAIGMVAVLGAVFVIGRATAPSGNQAALPATTSTSIVTVTATPSNTTSSSTPTASVSALPNASGSESVTSGLPGDGASLPKGESVFLTTLPRPNDTWNFEYGDHDVQLTQHPNSLWNTLATCNSRSYRGEQAFRLKNFTKLEVKAVGTDSTSDPRLTVKFEVFVNADDVTPIHSVVVNPGESKPLSVELPPGAFALRLRTSFVTAAGPPCRSGNAVWGSPYVVAAGR